MAAGIVKGANGAGPVAGDDDGIIAHLHREIVAGLGDLAVVADEQPVAIPDRLKIELVVIGVDVESLLEAVASEYPIICRGALRRRHPGGKPHGLHASRPPAAASHDRYSRLVSGLRSVLGRS
jgi:hypothetical protein